MSHIQEGMIFTEDSAGTNAIALTMILKKPMYTSPKQHYFVFLRNNHFYSISLHVNQEVVAYLAVTTAEWEISKEMIAITNLLGYQIVSESRCKVAQGEHSKIKLSSRQLDILNFMAKGMTDKAIALELNLSFDTVKSHKKILFRKLEANCGIEAVVKALRLNLISIN